MEAEFAREVLSQVTPGRSGSEFVAVGGRSPIFALGLCPP